MAQIVTGAELESQIMEDKDFKPRLLLPQLIDYLEEPPKGIVGILYGLRRTGKTTMISHAIQSLAPEERKKCAYILAQKGDRIDDAASIGRKLINENGIRYLFFDEATDMPDFIEGANIFSDILAKQQAHVVLAGTDSLGFRIAEKEKLYDRNRMIHTTWIGYNEHALLLKTADIDDYIESGGILPPHRRNLFKNYPMEAVVPNILHSLKNYDPAGRFGALERLHKKRLLVPAIQNVIKCNIHAFTAKILKSEYTLSDLEIAERPLEDDYARKILEKVDRKHLLDRIRERLEIKSRSLLKGITANEVYQINRYLVELDLIAPRITLHQAEIYPEININAINAKLAGGYMEDALEADWIFTQPGLRWAQIEVLLSELKPDLLLAQSELFPGMTDRKQAATAIDTIINSIKNNARGYVLEEIAVMQAMQSLGKGCDIFRYRPDIGDVDLVIASKDRTAFKAFEIKNDAGKDSRHSKHLRNTDVIHPLEGVFGNMLDWGIVYRGESTISRGGRYRNIADFLAELNSGSIECGLASDPGAPEEDGDDDGGCKP